MKYKLIKEYPGSPKLGYIDHLNKTGHNSQGEYVQSMYDTNPEFWEKVIEQPLFTSEDGVDIFKRDNIYWVNINTFDKVNCNKYNDDLGEISIKSLLSKKYECKAVGFSTKEKAEEYILLNKPCLSYNDVLNAVKIRNKNTFETLKDLVKSKIQQSV